MAHPIQDQGLSNFMQIGDGNASTARLKAKTKPCKLQSSPDKLAYRDIVKMQEFMRHLAQLPEKGKEVVHSLAQHINPRDWDLSEKAMHALQSIAAMPGARHSFEVCICGA